MRLIIAVRLQLIIWFLHEIYSFGRIPHNYRLGKKSAHQNLILHPPESFRIPKIFLLLRVLFPDTGCQTVKSRFYCTGVCDGDNSAGCKAVEVCGRDGEKGVWVAGGDPDNIEFHDTFIN